MPKISYAKLTLSWDRINTALGREDSEPFIEARRRELAAALAEVRERQQRQTALLEQAVSNTKLLREAVARGKEAEARLRALLKGAYGSKSKQLIRFGLSPQRKRRSGAPGAEAETKGAATGAGEDRRGHGARGDDGGRAKGLPQATDGRGRPEAGEAGRRPCAGWCAAEAAAGGEPQHGEGRAAQVFLE